MNAVKKTLVALAVGLFVFLPAAPSLGMVDNVVQTWPGGITQMPGECSDGSCG